MSGSHDRGTPTSCGSKYVNNTGVGVHNSNYYKYMSSTVAYKHYKPWSKKLGLGRQGFSQGDCGCGYGRGLCVCTLYVHDCVHVHVYTFMCVCVCVCVCVCSCIFVNGACINVESIPRIEDDLMYQSTLSELAKKRQQQQNDVPIELGVLRIEDPPHCVADPSRCVEGGGGGGREGGGERERERERERVKR